MPTNILTRRAALLSLGAFAAAGLGGCNTTPTGGVQPAAAAPGIASARLRSIRRRSWLMSAIRPRSWAQQALPGALAQASRVGRPRRAGASRPHRHALSGRGRAGRSRPDQRRRDRGRPYDKRTGECRQLRSKPDRSGAAGAGLQGSGAGAGGGVRLPAEEEVEGREADTRNFLCCRRSVVARGPHTGRRPRAGDRAPASRSGRRGRQSSSNIRGRLCRRYAG